MPPLTTGNDDTADRVAGQDNRESRSKAAGSAAVRPLSDGVKFRLELADEALRLC